jgi:hypothetical protein
MTVSDRPQLEDVVMPGTVIDVEAGICQFVADAIMGLWVIGILRRKVATLIKPPATSLRVTCPDELTVAAWLSPRAFLRSVADKPCSIARDW